MTFPEGFLWGAAASAYQIEGATDVGGRGASVWDTLCRQDGAIWGGHTADVACDHYHRYREDVALMRDLGLNAYRLSIGWPRVLPDGVGQVNTRGVDFYNRLIDLLLTAGITPFVTLFHWDYPQSLFDRGGWLSEESPDWFAEYAAVVADRFGDRVRHWLTINEPQVFLAPGSQDGNHAPGENLSRKQVLDSGHHVLLAHGKAVQALRAAAPECRIGCAPVGVVYYPASTGSADVEAARAKTFAVDGDTLFNNAWWMDPVFKGEYPEDGMRRYGDDVPRVRDGDLEVICQPLDFFAHNTYFGYRVRQGDDGPVEVPPVAGAMTTTMRWPVTPDVLYWGPRFFYDRYGLPVYITENGMANTDWIALDGRVHDAQRIDFVHRHLLALREAIVDGVDVRGYFYWSILDNFEWAEGYRERFGLVYVDYETHERTLKDSAHWYAKVIETNGAELLEKGDKSNYGIPQPGGAEHGERSKQ